MSNHLYPTTSGDSRLGPSLANSLKDWAIEAGFDLAGIAPATPGLGMERLRQWLDQEKHGEMDYMERNFAARNDPNLVLDGVESILVVALGYRSVDPIPPTSTQGRISRYAWGRDYHKVMREMLRRIATRLHEEAPKVRSRVAVDSAPVVERDYARLAGLGWFGKNTLLLNQRLGSWFFLGALLLDCSLDYDLPTTTDHCGTCRRCLDACPTQAFDGPYQLDPRKCVSYLTIEHKSEIPANLADNMGDWVFGCDVCQDVCPWNEHAARVSPVGGSTFHPDEGKNPIGLRNILDMNPVEFRKSFGDSPLERTGLGRLQRNARIALANSSRLKPPVPTAIPLVE